MSAKSKKKRSRVEKDAPFPVPIASITNTPCDENFWYQFTGHLQNDSVIVTLSGDIKYLYKMGFFGRGMLSRSAADFHPSLPYVYLPAEPGSEPDTVTVMKRRMYLRHKRWQKGCLGNSLDETAEEDVEFDSDLDHVQEQDLHEEQTGDYGFGEADKSNLGNTIDEDTQPLPLHRLGTASLEEETVDDGTETELSNLRQSDDQDTATRTEHSNRKHDEWDDCDANAEFWVNDGAKLHDREVTGDNHGKQVSDWDNTEPDPEFWGTPSNDLDNKGQTSDFWGTLSNDLDLNNKDQTSDFWVAPSKDLDNKGQTSDVLAAPSNDLDLDNNKGQKGGDFSGSLSTDNSKSKSVNSDLRPVNKGCDDLENDQPVSKKRKLEESESVCNEGKGVNSEQDTDVTLQPLCDRDNVVQGHGGEALVSGNKSPVKHTDKTTNAHSELSTGSLDSNCSNIEHGNLIVTDSTGVSPMDTDCNVNQNCDKHGCDSVSNYVGTSNINIAGASNKKTDAIARSKACADLNITTNDMRTKHTSDSVKTSDIVATNLSGANETDTESQTDENTCTVIETHKNDKSENGKHINEINKTEMNMDDRSKTEKHINEIIGTKVQQLLDHTNGLESLSKDKKGIETQECATNEIETNSEEHIVKETQCHTEQCNEIGTLTDGMETFSDDKKRIISHKDIKNETETNLEENNENKGRGTLTDDKTGAEKVVEKIHPYCDREDADADYLVIDDSDEESHMAGHVTSYKPIKNGFQWQPTMKKDPYPYTEPLILTSEEAYFLSYGLGCLTVLDGDGEHPLTLTSLWHRFCQRPRFLPCYAAYHHFRSRGWVPKSGVVFGTDFVLYKEGPPFFHGSYSVIVKAVYSGTYKPVEEYNNRTLTWAAFSGLQRITEHVAKTLLVCYVIIPPDLTEDEKTSPTCLSKLNISLQRYSRWVSSQEREQDKVAEMP